jgi:hypothetical protein
MRRSYHSEVESCYDLVMPDETNKVIIYHGGCPDGFGAAWWLGRHIGPHVKHPGKYNEGPPLDLCAGAEVWIVDFCYPPGDLADIAGVAVTVDVLDHHATAAGWAVDYGEFQNGKGVLVLHSIDDYCEVRELWGGDRVNLCIDQTRSGVGLVARFVRRWRGIDPPEFLLNIEDRDLWRFALPDTKDVFAAVTSRPHIEDDWDDMAINEEERQRFAGGVVGLADEGAAINRYRDQLIEQVVEHTFYCALDGHEVLMCSSPYAIGSDTAGELAKRAPSRIGGYCILHDDHVQIGLRSTADGPDVAELATRFGGGGHPHASGMRMSWADFFAATGARK